MLGEELGNRPPVPVDAPLRKSSAGGSCGNHPQAHRPGAALTCGVAVGDPRTRHRGEAPSRSEGAGRVSTGSRSPTLTGQNWSGRDGGRPTSPVSGRATPRGVLRPAAAPVPRTIGMNARILHRAVDEGLTWPIGDRWAAALGLCLAEVWGRAWWVGVEMDAGATSPCTGRTSDDPPCRTCGAQA